MIIPIQGVVTCIINKFFIMKNAHKLFALFFLTVLSISCTPQTADNEDPNDLNQIMATGDDGSADLDNDKDEEGD